MKKERRIEIIILAALFLVLTVSFCTFRYYKYEKPNTYNIVFKDIDSIVKGSPVKFMGINIGHVVKLRRKNNYIILKIKVTKKGVKIPDNTRAKVAFNGLGGSKSIELLPPEEEDPRIKGIVAAESLRLNDLSGIFRNLKDIALVINNFVQEIDPKALSDSFRDLSDPEMINRIDSDMERMIVLQNGMKETVAAVSEKEDSFTDFVEWLNKSVEGAKKMFDKKTKNAPEKSE